MTLLGLALMALGASAFSTAGVSRVPTFAARLPTAPVRSARPTTIAPTANAVLGVDGKMKADPWVQNLFTIPKSIVLRRVFKHIVFNVVCAALICAVRKQCPQIAFPAGAHGLAGASLGLLIAFRTNSAYARYWEARILWGGIMNTCRALSINIQTWIKPQNPFTAKEAIANLYNYPYAVSRQCRLENLGDGERPADVCEALQTSLRTARVEGEPISLYDLQLNTQSMNVDKLVDYTGALNRILKTPLPLSYSRHGSRFLTLWCATLPLAIGTSVSTPATLIVVGLISWLMLGIDSIGQLLEQPFSQPRGVGEPFDFGLPAEQMANDVATEIARVGKIPHENR